MARRDAQSLIIWLRWSQETGRVYYHLWPMHRRQQRCQDLPHTFLIYNQLHALGFRHNRPHDQDAWM